MGTAHLGIDPQLIPVRSELLSVARAFEGLITYGELGARFGIEPHYALPELLGEISAYEHGCGRPMLTAVVVNRETMMSGVGLARLAHWLGCPVNPTGDIWYEWYFRELRRVWSYWQRRRLPVPTRPRRGGPLRRDRPERFV